MINLFKKTILYIKSPSLFFYKILSKLQSKYDSLAKSKDKIDLEAFNDREFRLNTPAMVELKNGMKLWGDLGDYGVSRAAMFSTYEPSETNFFKQIIPTISEGLIIDIGANIGWFTLLFSQFSREVIAIEPRPNNFEYLKKNRDSNNLSNVEIINAAVSDSEGEGIVFVLPSAGNSGGTHFKSDPSEEFINELRNKDYEINKVPILLLDKIIGSRKVALIKIDIEGAEPYAIKGALNILKNSKPIILCEINPICLRSNGNMEPEEFLSFMASLNYEGFILNEDSSKGTKIDTQWDFGNTWKNIIFQSQ